MMALDPDTFELVSGWRNLEIIFMNPEDEDESKRDSIRAIPEWLCGEERTRTINVSELDQILDKGVTDYWEHSWEQEDEREGELDPPFPLEDFEDFDFDNEEEKEEDDRWVRKRGRLLLFYTMAKVDGEWLTWEEKFKLWIEKKVELAAMMKDIIMEKQESLKRAMERLEA